VRVSLHDLSTVESTERLKARKIDVALLPPPSGLAQRGISFEKVVSYAMCAALPVTHAFAAKRALPLARFGKEPVVGFSQEEYPEYLHWLQQLFRPHGIEPKIAEECDSASSLIAAVEADRGIALVTSSMSCLAGPRLKLLPLTPALPDIVVGALYVKPTPRWVPEFIEAVKQAASQGRKLAGS
jgi:DNA-binding transcriptional LysR family regulator